MRMTINRTALAREALDTSLDIRGKVGCDLGTPVNVLDLCDALTPQVRVLFTDYSMEGCYLKSARPLIQVSALRPLGRRAFNCAHELGHHAFGHGSRIDELQSEERPDATADPEEFLANAFGGFLLMPRIAIRGAFTRRGWKASDGLPEQYYTVACHLGVGYETLVSHMEYGLREIPNSLAEQLRKVRLPAVRRALVGSDQTERLSVVDRHYALPNVDTETGTHLLLPRGSTPERSEMLTVVADLPSGRLMLADRPGLCRVEADENWAVVIRVARYQYAGWSRYRHLELEDDDD